VKAKKSGGTRKLKLAQKQKKKRSVSTLNGRRERLNRPSKSPSKLTNLTYGALLKKMGGPAAPLSKRLGTKLRALKWAQIGSTPKNGRKRDTI